MSVIGSNRRGTVVTIIGRRNSPLSQEGEPIKVWMPDLVDLNVEAIFEPLGRQVSMAPRLARVAIGWGFPTEQHRKIAEAHESIVDFPRVEAVEDFAVQLDVPSGAHGTKPIAGL
jgi:hypothetical protein